jgi:amidohydrolase
MGLQTIASRQVNVAYLPSVLTVGQIAGGNRSNKAYGYVLAG